MGNMSVIKVIEVIGASKDSMEGAVKNAVTEAAKTVNHIVGVDVLGWTAKVEDGKIVCWNANVKIAFEIRRD